MTGIPISWMEPTLVENGLSNYRFDRYPDNLENGPFSENEKSENIFSLNRKCLKK